MAGYLPDETITDITNLVINVRGDFAELGVYKASLFKRLVPIATKQGKIAHGFDSFCGMDEPTLHDAGNYEKGKLSVGGIESFKKIMERSGVSDNHYKLYDGYVPDCLNKLDDSVRFSFAYIDFDHYEPTRVSINWILERMALGGILGFDDYFDKDILASKAINEFLFSEFASDYKFIQNENNQLFIKKIK